MGKLQANFSLNKINKASIKKNSLGNGAVSSKEIITLDKGFFPALGNHDYDDPNRDGTEYLEYFKFLNKINGNTSNSNKYYDVIINDCHFFVLDSDPVCGGSNHIGNISDPYPAGKGIPGSNSNDNYTATQKKWFNNRIKESTSKYKFVFQHHPSYNSGSYHRGYPKLSPHKGWKTHLADAVFSGHEHFYERIKFQTQYPNYISITKVDNRLKIQYLSNGPLFNTSQLRIHIGNDDWQNLIDASTTSSFMYRQNMGYGQLEDRWTYYYTIPDGADYINFAFRSNGGSWDNNVLNSWVYDYIYYLNDSNDFNKTTFIVNGNSGHDLRSFSDQIIPQSLSRINNKYGFTEARIYSNGLEYIHYGIGDGENSFSLADYFGMGNIDPQTFLFSFAVIADWGNGGGINTVPANFFDPPNNYFANKIADEIKNKNIKYIFGVGDLSYNGVLYRTISQSGPRYTIQSVPPSDPNPESPSDDIDPLLRDSQTSSGSGGSGSGGSGSGGSGDTFPYNLSLNVSSNFNLPAFSSGLDKEYIRIRNIGDSIIKIYSAYFFTYYGSAVVGSPYEKTTINPGETKYFISHKVYNSFLEWSVLTSPPGQASPVGLSLLNEAINKPKNLKLNLNINTVNIELYDSTIPEVNGVYYKDSETDDEVNWASDDTPYLLVLYKNLDYNNFNNNYWNLIEVLDSVDENGNNYLSLIATNPSSNLNAIPQEGWIDEESEPFILKTKVYYQPQIQNQDLIYTTFSIDENVGRFYSDYITCYQGLYIDKNTTDSQYLKLGLKPYDPRCLNISKQYA